MTRIFAAALSLFFFISSPFWAQGFDTSARVAMIVDQTTGAVLLAKNADTPVPPASMSKLMTLNMLFEALREGRVTMETEFLVSEKANAIGGSTMFLRAGERVSVGNLIQGIIVQSGNDACIAVAENLSGTEEAFAVQMTERAKSLGMVNSTFANSTGWPHPAQRMSARDLVFLANRLITEFPEYYGYFAQDTFTWDGVTQENRNPLLGLGIGADGLKTGHTNEAGYGLVGSVKQGDRRVIFMISGLESQQGRAREAEKIANWAFRQFTMKPLYEKDVQIAEANVWLGATDTVPLVSATDITTMVALGKGEDVQAKISYTGPIEAPIAAGTELATLTISSPGLDDRAFPLVAGANVEKGGLITRVKASAEILAAQLMGYIRPAEG